MFLARRDSEAANKRKTLDTLPLGCSILRRCRLFFAYQLFPFIVPCQALLAACILMTFAAVVQTSEQARFVSMITSSTLLFTWTVCYVRTAYTNNPSLPSEAWLSVREFNEYLAWKTRYEKALTNGELRRQSSIQQQQFVINDPALRQPRFICGRAFLMAAKQRKWITYEQQKRYMKQMPLEELRDMAAQASPVEFVARVCEKCRAVLPDRAWHCNCCNKCVLKLYHHCPMLRNCIAYKNLKIYILFLGYQFLLNVQTLIACILIALVIVRPNMPFPIVDEFIGRNSQLSNSASTVTVGTGFLSVALDWWMVLVVIGLSAPFYALNTAYVGWLFIVHARWVVQNQTEHEYHRPAFFGSGRFAYSTFDMGNSFKNFVQVFGSNPLLWCSPTNTSTGNGIDYPVRNYAPASVWNNNPLSIAAAAAAAANSMQGEENNSVIENYSQNNDHDAEGGSTQVERAHLKMLAKEAELSGISADSQLVAMEEQTKFKMERGFIQQSDAEKLYADVHEHKPAASQSRSNAIANLMSTIWTNITARRTRWQNIERDRANKAERESAIRASEIEEKQRHQQLENWKRKQSHTTTAEKNSQKSIKSFVLPVSAAAASVAPAVSATSIKRKLECLLADDNMEADNSNPTATNRPAYFRSIDDDQASSRATTTTTYSIAAEDGAEAARDTEYEADVENNVGQYKSAYMRSNLTAARHGARHATDDRGDMGEVDDDVEYEGGAGSSIVNALSHRSVYEPNASSAGSSYFPITTATSTANESSEATSAAPTPSATEYETGDEHRHATARNKFNKTGQKAPNWNDEHVTVNWNRRPSNAAMREAQNVGDLSRPVATVVKKPPIDYYFKHDDKQRLFM